MKAEINLYDIFNYEDAEKLARKAYIDSIFTFKNTLILILAGGFQIPVIDSPDILEGVGSEYPRRRYSFNLQTGKTHGSFKIKFIITPDGMINFTIFILNKSDLEGSGVHWDELLDTPTINEVKDKQYLYMAEFMPLIPKIALAMGGIKSKEE